MATLVRVIGGGLAGAATAHLLARAGYPVEVIEAEPTWGGQLRTASANGILYEPAGAHIFHTADREVWQLVTSLVRMRPYRHQVHTQAFGRTLSWPPQRSELRELSEWPTIERELAARHVGLGRPERFPRPGRIPVWGRGAVPRVRRRSRLVSPGCWCWCSPVQRRRY